MTITLIQQQIQHILQHVNPKVSVPKEVVNQTQDPIGRLEAHEAPSYAAMAQASTVAPQEAPPQALMTPVKKISYNTDSIGGNVIFEEL